MSSDAAWLVTALFFAVALLYSSVGFGGASSYLAVMSYFEFPPATSATIALTLNVFVATIAFFNYFRGGHFRGHLLWPFLITSIPAAFIGGSIHIEEVVYQILLNVILLYVAVRLFFFPQKDLPNGRDYPRPSSKITLAAGAILGLVSGVVGVGGGIFLSPLIVLAGWGNSKQAATASAGFIVLNSLGGLVGRAWGGTLDYGSMGFLLIPVGVIGGLLGSYLGVRRLPNLYIQRLLAVILLAVVLRSGLALVI